MRILQVAPPWFAVPPHAYGGIELMIAALADGLVEQGHDVTLLASGGSHTAAHLHSVYEEPPSTLLGDAMTELLHVMEVDDLGDFDVIHDHTLIGATRLAARGTPRVVHTLHGPWSSTGRRVYGRLSRDVGLVAISHDQAAHAPEVALAGVVHNGIDLDRYPVGLDRTDELVFVGRANPEKGPALAIEAARRTGRPLSMAIKVNEPEEHEYWSCVLEPRTHDLGIDVVFNATHERKVEMLARAHAVLVPIQWDEPFGLVMVEAGACGAPVVAFARGAAPEIVRDGVTGRLVPPLDGIDGLVDAIGRVDEISPAACRAHVDAHFSSQRMVEGYLEIYEALRHGDQADLARSVHPSGLAGPPLTLV